jgi:hypothetical protein
MKQAQSGSTAVLHTALEACTNTLECIYGASVALHCNDGITCGPLLWNMVQQTCPDSLSLHL